VLSSKVIRVSLSREEIELASNIGRERDRVHKLAGTHDGKVCNDGVQIHIDGAIAEYAVAKALNLEWTGKLYSASEWGKIRRSNKDKDVGGFGVRASRHPSGRLILHPWDDDSTPFILVILFENEAVLKGWVYAKDGKKDEYWLDVGYGRPAYYVDSKALRHDWEYLMHFP
jgi:hypothetical protein